MEEGSAEVDNGVAGIEVQQFCYLGSCSDSEAGSEKSVWGKDEQQQHGESGEMYLMNGVVGALEEQRQGTGYTCIRHVWLKRLKHATVGWCSKSRKMKSLASEAVGDGWGR